MPFDHSTLNENARATVIAAAQRIHEHNLIQVESIIQIGQELLKVRKILGHGKFGKWITHEFGWGRRTAYNYMNAAMVFGGKCAIVAHLQPMTVYQFSKPSLPQPVKDEVHRLLEQGETIEDFDLWTAAKRYCSRDPFKVRQERPPRPETIALARL